MKSNKKIREGYKKTAVGVIPKEWEVKRLNSLGEIVGGGTPRTTIPIYWNGDINWFTPTEIKHKYASKSKRKISKIGLANSSAKLLPVGTILLTTRATIGEASISTEKCTTNQGFQSIICNDSTSTLFLYELIKFNKHELIRRANGSTFLEISGRELRKIKLPIPPLHEQQAIADCLTTWDKGIETLSTLIEAKEEQKKGLMQQLLTGKKRLDGFTGEWEEVRLEEVAKVVMGVSPSSGNYNNDKNGMLLIQGNADIENRVSKPRQYTTQVTKECYVGDILMSVRAPVGEISRCIHNACIGRGICAIQSKSNINNDFLFYILVYTEVLWNRFKQGSTFESVNTTDIRNFKIKIPSKEEQTAIAHILTTADKEISLLKKKLAAMKEEKKGLMQVLLTGEKRLIVN